MINSFPHSFKSRYYVEKEHWNAHVKVDYDSDRNPPNLEDWRKTAAWLKRQATHVDRVSVFRTAKGFHLRMWLVRRVCPYGVRVTTVSDVDSKPWTILRIQKMLGDDPMRQRFNERRVRRKEDGWNVLWNEKWRNGRLLYRETEDTVLTREAERIFGAPTRVGCWRTIWTHPDELSAVRKLHDMNCQRCAVEGDRTIH